MAIHREANIILALHKIEKARTAGEEAHRKEMIALGQFHAAIRELEGMEVDTTTLVQPWGTHHLGQERALIYARNRLHELESMGRGIREERKEGWERNYDLCFTGVDELCKLIHEATKEVADGD